VSGRRAVEVVPRPIRAHVACFKRCYELGLAKDPALRGRVAVKLVIGASSGAVRTTEDAGSELPDKEVVACVVAEFMAVRFAAPERGDITVTYPIMFEPASESP
jgi:hypothetical protein